MITNARRNAGSRWLVASALVLLILLAAVGVAQIDSVALDVGERIRYRLEYSLPSSGVHVESEPIYTVTALPAFYERVGFTAVWSRKGELIDQADSLLGEIKRSAEEGLNPADYHLAVIELLLNELSLATPGTPERRGILTDLDLLLTDAFLILSTHYVKGRVDPFTFDAEWLASPRDLDAASYLFSALETGTVAESMRRLLPQQTGYALLRDQLRALREEFASDVWERILDGPALKPGMEDPRVPELRARLAASGEYPGGESDSLQPLRYDPALVAAVKKFQAHNGLDADGTIGSKTLAALNTSIEERIKQVELNLERWRWLPENLGNKYVIVNIANFELRVIEADTTAMSMRAIVGRAYRRTPVFSDYITYLVLNPYWHVPPKLAVQDKLPEIRKDPDYFTREGFKVYRGFGAGRVEIDPNSVDWNAVSAKNFPYWLRQEPGPRNALGQVKFMFPNKFNVYLHDTPNRELFVKPDRSLSSGCIRIEQPVELALELLREDPAWNAARLKQELTTAVDKTVMLPRKIPVHLLYWTAWVDEDGTAEFRRDIYGRDSLLSEALFGAPPDTVRVPVSSTSILTNEELN